MQTTNPATGPTRPVTLTVPQVAALLGIGRNTVYRALQNGEIRAVRVGRAVRVRTADVEALLGQPLDGLLLDTGDNAEESASGS